MNYQFNNCHLQPKGASIVYWAHLPEHDDMYTQGYIGITKQPALLRWRDHISYAKKETQLPFARALNKYQNIVFDIIVIGQDREYCEAIEAQLRPDLNIGWNINIGGDKVNTLAGGLANKARLDNLKATNPYWIAKEQAKQDAKAKAQLKRESAAQSKKEREEYKKQQLGWINRKISERNTTGITGVSYWGNGKYTGRIRVLKKNYTIGYFDDKEIAGKVYQLVKQYAIKFNPLTDEAVKTLIKKAKVDVANE